MQKITTIVALAASWTLASGCSEGDAGLERLTPSPSGTEGQSEDENADSDGGSTGAETDGFETDSGGDQFEPAADRSSLAGAMDPVAASSPTCPAGVDCANDVPMTGDVSGAFSPVDTAMRQFVKWRCAGAATLAMSYKGRRIYQRGFGRMHSLGSNFAECQTTGDVPDFQDELPQPNTPMRLGSVAKAIAAPAFRLGLAEHIDNLPQATKNALVAEYGSGVLTDQDVQDNIRLLDDNAALLPQPLHDILAGDAPLLYPRFVGENDPPAPAACSGLTAPSPRADTRWASVTVGQIIGNHAGLHRSNIPHDEVLKFWETQTGGEWQAREAQVLNELSPGEALAAAQARAVIQSSLPGDIAFAPWSDDGQTDLERKLLMMASRCLEYTPGTTNADHYTNTGAPILSLILENITGKRYTSDDGFLTSATRGQANTVVEDFFEFLGVEEGIEGEFAAYTFQGVFPNSQPSSSPTPRSDRSGFDPYSTKSPETRPYCEVSANGDSCSFEEYLSGNNRLDWTFELGEQVPFWAGSGSNSGHASGNLLAEMPALLKVAETFIVTEPLGESNSRQGQFRNQQWFRSGRKGGAGKGMRSYLGVFSSNLDIPVPDTTSGSGVQWIREVAGDPDWTSPSTVTTVLPEGIAFAVAVNQKSDDRAEVQGLSPNQEDYSYLNSFPRFGLSQVDWDDVRHELWTRKHTVAGLGIHGAAVVYTAENRQNIYGSASGLMQGSFLPVPSYNLSGARDAADVVGVAYASSGRKYAYYRDGSRSCGLSSSDLQGTCDATSYTLPTGYSPDDVLDVGISSNNTTTVWFADGQRAKGTTTSMTSSVASFTLPVRQLPTDINGIGIDSLGGNRVHAIYKDGSASEGTSRDLDQYEYQAATPSALAIGEDGRPFELFANNYWKEHKADLEFMEDDPSPLFTFNSRRGHARLVDAADVPDDPTATYPDAARTMDEVVGVVRVKQTGVMSQDTFVVFYDDGTGAAGGLVDGPDGPELVFDQGSFTYSTGSHSRDDITAIALSTGNILTVWYDTGVRTKGHLRALNTSGTSHMNLTDVVSNGSFSLPTAAGLGADDVAAAGIDEDNATWMIFKDGRVSRGTTASPTTAWRSWDLGVSG